MLTSAICASVQRDALKWNICGAVVGYCTLASPLAFLKVIVANW